MGLFLPWFWYFHICSTHVQLHCPIPARRKMLFASCLPPSGACFLFKSTATPSMTCDSIPMCHCPDLAAGELSWNISEYLGPSEDVQGQTGLGHTAPFSFTFVACARGMHISFPWLCERKGSLSNKQRILDVGIMKKRRNIAMERLLWIVLNALQPFVKLTGPKMRFRSFESKPAVKELYFLSRSCNGKYICLPRQSCKKYC